MTIELCSITEFENQKTKGFVVNGTSLFVIKDEDKYFAYLNHCPHNHIPLDWGNNVFLDFDEELIQCSSHGAVFAIDSGRCLAGPCIDETLSRLEIEVKDNALYLLDKL